MVGTNIDLEVNEPAIGHMMRLLLDPPLNASAKPCVRVVLGLFTSYLKVVATLRQILVANLTKTVRESDESNSFLYP